MSTLEAIVLGIVQGLTEFLPISSSGHVLFVPALAGWPDPGAAFSAVIQLGTMAAVLIYFRQDLWNILRAFLRSLVGDRTLWRTSDVDARVGWFILLGTIPIGVFGLAFSNQIETAVRSVELAAIVMIGFSFVLLAADRVGARTRGVDSLTLRDGIVIGFFQVLALVPGVSRSGSTISGGLFMGLDRESATRYSFLLSVPAVVLSGLFELRKVGEAGPGNPSLWATAVATVFAFIFGYAAIAFLLRYVRSHNFNVFIAYRLIVGTVVLVLALNGTIA